MSTRLRRSARLISTVATYSEAKGPSKTNVNSTTRRYRTQVVQKADVSDSTVIHGIRDSDIGPAVTRTKRPRRGEATIAGTVSGSGATVSGAPAPKRRRKSPPPSPDPDNFPTRPNARWKIGPHVSSAGGVENAVVNAASVGATAFALFLKSQRKWESKDISETSVEKFQKRLKAFGYGPECVLPHGNYLVNLGNPDEEKRKKSYECFLDDLRRCEQLGLHLYNFHPGSTVGQTTSSNSIALIAQCLNRAHAATRSVITVLENMAGAGNVIGSTFRELGEIIKLVEDKTRVGVCLDTCHMFAAGYDIRTKEGWESTMAEFEQEIGLTYLRGMHLNDSKAALSSKKDRHENIGLGHLALPTFAHILSDSRTQGIPLILETPSFEEASRKGDNDAMEMWRKEVEVLHRLADASIESADHEWEQWTTEIKQVAARRKALKDRMKPTTESGITRRKRNSKAALEDVEAEADSEHDDEGDHGGDNCCGDKAHAR